MVYTPKETIVYEEALAWAGKSAMKGRPPIEGPIEVTMVATMTIPPSWTKKKQAAALAGTVRPTGVPDWDNLAKTLDGLNKIVWIDDAQIVRGVLEKVYGPEPMLRIEVKPIEIPDASLFSSHG